MVVSEVVEELPDHLFLVICEIGNVIQLMDIAQVGEELLGVYHVLVHIVEVGKQQLSPTIEMVQGLVDARTFHEGLVQIADRFDGVSNLQVRVASEEVADGDIGGSPDRLMCQLCQVVVEEE